MPLPSSTHTSPRAVADAALERVGDDRVAGGTRAGVPLGRQPVEEGRRPRRGPRRPTARRSSPAARRVMIRIGWSGEPSPDDVWPGISMAGQLGEGARHVRPRWRGARRPRRSCGRAGRSWSGPTPPTRGVIQPATSSQDSSTSGRSLRPSYWTPAPTTTPPGLMCSGWIIPGTPAAAMRMSARRVCSAQSATPVCTTVTAALAVGRFCDSRMLSGRPIVTPRPTITTS